MEKLIISSEDDAWDALKRATNGEAFGDDLQIVFKGWPAFTMDVKGKDWDSTVPSRVMGPLLDVQKDIHRAYASIQYGGPNLRKLKEEERDQLEVVVKVEKGSSLFSAGLWKQLTELAQVAVSRMSGEQAVITVLGIALAIAAPVMFKMWINGRLKTKEMETRVELSQQETERLKVFAEAVRAQPVLSEVRDDSLASHNRLLKAVKPGDSVNLKDVKLSSSEVESIVQPERERAQDVHLQGDFKILGNRTDKTSGFRITVQRISDNLTINADVPTQLPYNQQLLLQKAEWGKTLVSLHINASQLRDAITQAEVISVAKVDEASE